MKRALPLLLLSTLPFFGACQADLLGGSGADGGQGSGANGSTHLTDGRADITPARLLTDVQYNNAVRVLFGNTERPLTEQIAATGDLYDNDASALLANSHVVNAFEETASRVAAKAFESGAVQFDCASGESEGECASAFIENWGLKVFRRPPTAEEATALRELFSALRAEPVQDSAADAAQGVLSAMLQMPGFLYHAELGEGSGAGGDTRLNGYEIASRLAFALTNAPPDDELLGAAAAGELDSDDGVRAQAERLLDGQDARAGLFHFVEQWLGISDVDRMNRDEALFPAYSDTLGVAMREEARRFFEELFWEQSGTVPDLYTADYTFVNAELAALYGVEGEFGNDFEKVTLPAERRGVLTQSAYLAAHSVFDRTSPVARGVYTLRKILCMELGSPPNNVGALPEKSEVGGSVREQLEVHSQGACVSCHQYIDPVGLSFEAYDAVGKFREQYDDGLPVETDGSVTIDGDAIEIVDGVDFSAVLADSNIATSCFTKQMMSYALGRTLDRKDQAAVDQIAEETKGLREIVLSVVASEPFLYRDVPAAEECK